MAEATKQKLVIVESPAKAKTIEKFLGKGYKVTASQGHVRDLPKSQLGVDTDHDFAMKYITIRGRGEIIAKLKKEAKNASRIFLATDPDREGEAISWHLANLLQMDDEKPCRIEFQEITKKAVKDSIGKVRAIDMDRVDAQQARRALDRLVGYKISPLLWVKIKKGLSAGRVQSVATKLVVQREEEIERFIPEEFWDVLANAVVKNQKGKSIHLQAKLTALDGKKAVIQDEKSAMAAKTLILNSTFVVSNVNHGEKLKRPQPPFTTSSLQQEASRKLRFATGKTMQVVQSLYDGVNVGRGTVGLVTYIRTDSVRISSEALTAVREMIRGTYGAEYCPPKPNFYKGRKNAQDAHEAIRPTDLSLTPELVKKYLTRDQFNLYRLIYTRFMASQMKPAVFETVTVDMHGAPAGDPKHSADLRYYGEHMTFAGYRVLYTESRDDEEQKPESVIPALEKGDPVSVEDVETKQWFTQPPSRYTEASLVRALEEKGIGRPSTYAPTITTIISRGYVAREKRRLYPTELGKMVTSMMLEYFAPIVDTEFTALLEDKLDDVEEGKAEWRAILRDFYPPFEKMLNVAEEQIEKIEVKDEISDVPCDKCGAMMVYKMGRYGRFLACPNFPDCRNTKPIVKYVEAPCPKCGARLMEKISKKNRKFYGCERYPECDFVSWELPAKEKCSQCGSYMTEKHNKKGERILLCANETCRYREKKAAQKSE